MTDSLVDIDALLNADALYSSLGTDPDLGELVEMFVDEMPDRIASMQQSVETGDWEELCRIAHQLKGASGSYGFDQLTPFAAQLEKNVRESAGSPATIESLDHLITLCDRLRPGAP